jgi:hypothetical protein
MHSWQPEIWKTGMVLLSDGIRHSQNADTLEQFFSSGAERAFEIAAAMEMTVATVSRSCWSCREDRLTSLVNFPKSSWSRLARTTGW